MKKLIIVAAIALSACAGTNFSWDKARQLQPGMTTQEVEAMMGSPNNIKTTPDGMVWVWVWVNLYSQTKTLAVTFQDNKLTKVPQIPDGYK